MFITQRTLSFGIILIPLKTKTTNILLLPMSTENAPRFGFAVIKNNGAEDGYTNSCMFISIMHLMKLINASSPAPSDTNYALPKSIGEIRSLACFPGSDNSMWDKDLMGHVGSINMLCNKIGMQICVFYANYDKAIGQYWIGSNMEYIYGSAQTNRRGSIVAWGNHFEAIISATSFSDTFPINHVDPSLRCDIKSYLYFVTQSTEQTDRSQQVSSYPVPQCTEISDNTKPDGQKQDDCQEKQYQTATEFEPNNSPQRVQLNFHNKQLHRRQFYGSHCSPFLGQQYLQPQFQPQASTQQPSQTQETHISQTLFEPQVSAQQQAQTKETHIPQTHALPYNKPVVRHWNVNPRSNNWNQHNGSEQIVRRYTNYKPIQNNQNKIYEQEINDTKSKVTNSDSTQAVSQSSIEYVPEQHNRSTENLGPTRQMNGSLESLSMLTPPTYFGTVVPQQPTGNIADFIQQNVPSTSGVDHNVSPIQNNMTDLFPQGEIMRQLIISTLLDVTIPNINSSDSPELPIGMVTDVIKEQIKDLTTTCNVMFKNLDVMKEIYKHRIPDVGTKTIIGGLVNYLEYIVAIQQRIHPIFEATL